jgi:hypothetical protein
MHLALHWIRRQLASALLLKYYAKAGVMDKIKAQNLVSPYCYYL